MIKSIQLKLHHRMNRTMQPNKLSIKHFCLLSIIVVQVFTASAQKHNENVFDSLQSVVNKQFTPVIAQSVKINSAPALPDSSPKMKVGPYTIFSTQLPTTFDLVPIKAASIQGEPLQKLTPGFIKLGFSAPYNIIDAGAFYNSVRSKESSYGIAVQTLSSESNSTLGTNMGYYDNNIALTAKKFYNSATLSGNLDLGQNLVHFYGYNPSQYQHVNADSLVQKYNLVKAEIALMSTKSDSSHPNYKEDLHYANFSDAYKASENWLNANFRGDGFYDRQRVAIGANLDYLNHRSSRDTINDFIVKIGPEVSFLKSQWKAVFGTPFAVDFASSTYFYWHPKAELNVQLIQEVLYVFGGINGDLERNSFESLTAANPYMSSNFQLKNTDWHREFIGTGGAIDRYTYFRAYATFSQVNNMALYEPDHEATYHNKFIVGYDNANVISGHGEVVFNKLQTTEVKLTVDYNHYNMTSQQYAWYKPEIRVGATINHNIGGQLFLNASLYYLGSQHYFTYNPQNQMVEGVIQGMPDLNLGLDYKYSKKFTMYLNVNNLASVNYQRWYNYPSQGIYAIIGLKVAL